MAEPDDEGPNDGGAPAGAPPSDSPATDAGAADASTADSGTADSTDDATGDDNFGIATDGTAAQGVPFTLPASLKDFSAARSAGTFNAFHVDDAQPIVQPRVTIWKTYEAPCSGVFMRPPGQRGSQSLSGDDNWLQNGCHPTCLSMVLDWWQCQNPATKGTLRFPYPNDPPAKPRQAGEPAVAREASEPAGLHPIEMCRRMFNIPYAPSVPSAKQPGKFDVNHNRLRYDVKPVDTDDGRTGPLDLGGVYQGGVSCVLNQKVWPMQTVVYNNWSNSRDQVKAAIKYLLELGPILIQLIHPAHYVVVRGYRDDKMYICDPSACIVDANHWGRGPGVKSCNGMVEIDCSKANLIYIAGSPPNEKPLTGLNWLDNIVTIEASYFDDNAGHPEWSDRDQSKP